MDLGDSQIFGFLKIRITYLGRLGTFYPNIPKGMGSMCRWLYTCGMVETAKSKRERVAVTLNIGIYFDDLIS